MFEELKKIVKRYREKNVPPIFPQGQEFFSSPPPKTSEVIIICNQKGGCGRQPPPST